MKGPLLHLLYRCKWLTQAVHSCSCSKATEMISLVHFAQQGRGHNQHNSSDFDWLYTQDEMPLSLGFTAAPDRGDWRVISSLYDTSQNCLKTCWSCMENSEKICFHFLTNISRWQSFFFLVGSQKSAYRHWLPFLTCGRCTQVPIIKSITPIFSLKKEPPKTKNSI